jgi:hypothetical protein
MVVHFNCNPSPYGGFFVDTVSYIDTINGQPTTWISPIIRPNVSHNLDLGHDTNRLFRVYSNTFYAGAGGYQYYSDSRLKTNIEKLNAQDVLEKVLEIDGYTYTYNETALPNTPSERVGQLMSKRKIGVMAEELILLFPECVQSNPSEYYSVDYNLLVPLLIESIKELNARLDVLEQLVKE